MNELTKDQRIELTKRAKEIIGEENFINIDLIGSAEQMIFDYIMEISKKYNLNMHFSKQYYKVKIIDGKIYFPKFVDYDGKDGYDSYLVSHYHDRPWMVKGLDKLTSIFEIPFAYNTDPMYCRCLTNHVTVSSAGIECVNCGNIWDFPYEKD